MDIDTERYSVGSARRMSYDMGWNDAEKDYRIPPPQGKREE